MVTLNLDDIDSLTPSLHPSVFAQGPHGPLGANIFVFHIPDDWNDETFFKYFAPFGEVESGGIQTDKRTGRFRGFGFVSYRHPLHAAKAIKWMDGMRVMKKRLAVQPKTGEGVFLNAALDAERKAQNKPIPIPRPNPANCPSPSPSPNSPPISPSPASATPLNGNIPHSPSPLGVVVSSPSMNLSMGSPAINMALGSPSAALGLAGDGYGLMDTAALEEHFLSKSAHLSSPILSSSGHLPPPHSSLQHNTPVLRCSNGGLVSSPSPSPSANSANPPCLPSPLLPSRATMLPPLRESIGTCSSAANLNATSTIFSNPSPSTLHATMSGVSTSNITPRMNGTKTAGGNSANGMYCSNPSPCHGTPMTSGRDVRTRLSPLPHGFHNNGANKSLLSSSPNTNSIDNNGHSQEYPPPYDESMSTMVDCVNRNYSPRLSPHISPRLSPHISPRDGYESMCNFLNQSLDNNRLQQSHFSPILSSNNPSLPSSSPVLLPAVTIPLSLLSNPSNPSNPSFSRDISPSPLPSNNNSSPPSHSNNPHSQRNENCPSCNNALYMCHCNNYDLYAQSSVSSPSLAPPKILHSPSSNLHYATTRLPDTPIMDNNSSTCISSSSNIWTPVTYEASPIFTKWLDCTSPLVGYNRSASANMSPAFGVVRNLQRMGFKNCLDLVEEGKGGSCGTGNASSGRGERAERTERGENETEEKMIFEEKMKYLDFEEHPMEHQQMPSANYASSMQKMAHHYSLGPSPPSPAAPPSAPSLHSLHHQNSHVSFHSKPHLAETTKSSSFPHYPQESSIIKTE